MNLSLLFAVEPTTFEFPTLPFDIWWPLGILHFLEFGIWGMWYVILGSYLEGLNFSRKNIARAYATIPLASIIAPMFVGTIADRYFNTEHVMGALHLGGAVLLVGMAVARDQKVFYWVTLAYAILYAPTLALVNPLTFRHLPAGGDAFPLVRVMGTVGWIVAGLSLKFMIKPGEKIGNRFLFATALLSLALGIYSFFLPATPPLPGKDGEIPFLQALKLFQDNTFAVFFTVALLVALSSAFYFSWAAVYLERGVHVKPENIGPLMTIGQWVELPFIFTLPVVVYWMGGGVAGVKGVLAIGLAAWALRYLFFSVGRPFPLVIAGIGLHGICFDFFFVASFMFVNARAPGDIQNSAHSLFNVLTYGLGMYLGGEMSGWLNNWLTTERLNPATGEKERITNWRMFWLVPSGVAALSLALFLLTF